MRLEIITFGLIPFLVIQGYCVKKNIPRLPEANGFRKGIVGQGKRLSILIIGDSAAAGVGVETQKDALLGAILDELKQNFEIHYQLEAETGNTTVQALQKVKKIRSQQIDVVITSVGVNDVTKLITPNKWIQQQKILYSVIENKFSPQLVLVTAVPPMQLFPALPNPLGWLFGQYSSGMNEKLIEFIQKKQNYQLIEFDLTYFKALNLEMAEDGFHPSKEIYQLWANGLIQKIKAFF